MEGFGDWVKAGLDATGLSKLAPKDCKCEERRKKLNAYLPFPRIRSKRKPNSLPLGYR